MKQQRYHFLMGISGILMVALLFLSGCTGFATKTQDNTVSLPLSEVTSDMTKYTYDADGVEVRYFAVKDNDGTIRTGFDACDVCGGAKGYRQEGDTVVCNNCGLAFDINQLGIQNKGGGCWPGYLDHEIADGQIHIETDALYNGRNRFI